MNKVRGRITIVIVTMVILIVTGFSLTACIYKLFLKEETWRLQSMCTAIFMVISSVCLLIFLFTAESKESADRFFKIMSVLSVSSCLMTTFIFGVILEKEGLISLFQGIMVAISMWVEILIPIEITK